MPRRRSLFWRADRFSPPHNRTNPLAGNDCRRIIDGFDHANRAGVRAAFFAVPWARALASPNCAACVERKMGNRNAGDVRAMGAIVGE